jgi:acetyltransferase-like isoleucine patch superfamily enzyme
MSTEPESKPAGGPEFTFNPEAHDTIEVKAFLEFRERGEISMRYAIPLALKALITDIPFAVLKNWPGPVGMKLRQLYYRMRFAAMGRNVIIGPGVEISQPNRITVSDYAFIDKAVHLDAMAGSIHIGRRNHIAPYAFINGVGAGIHLGDYVGVGAFARIYSHSEAPIDGKRMSGPMIPESMKGMITAPVVVEKDGLIGTGAVILPGVTIGEGAVIAANSVVLAKTQIRPWTIYGGIPAKFLGMRKKVTVPDI